MIGRRHILIFILTTLLISNARAQNFIHDSTFTKFVGKSYKLPDSLKNSCEWMYAIVRVDIDASDKITGYHFINDPDDAIKKQFNYLIGYRFTKKLKLNKRSVIFFIGFDYLDGCVQKPGDKIFYAPNDVASLMMSYFDKISRMVPESLIISDFILIKGGSSYN